MSAPDNSTPEARLRTKLRVHAAIRHVCVQCDRGDLLAVLEALESERAAAATLRLALAIIACTAGTLRSVE
jgi:hypothetical protein